MFSWFLLVVQVDMSAEHGPPVVFDSAIWSASGLTSDAHHLSEGTLPHSCFNRVCTCVDWLHFFAAHARRRSRWCPRLSCPLLTATEHFVILLMAFLWWPIVPLTHNVSVEARSPSGWYDGVEVTTRRALWAVRMPTHPVDSYTRIFPSTSYYSMISEMLYASIVGV